MTKAQKTGKRRQMISLVSLPLLLAVMLTGVLFATGVIMPWTTADEIAADNEKVIYIPDSDISGTAAELAKIKSLVLVGGYSFTDEDKSFFCDPVLETHSLTTPTGLQ